MKRIIITSLLVVSVSIVWSQDYRISFTGSGATTIVDSVHVLNITQNTSTTLPGSAVLHLVDEITGISPVFSKDRELSIYPNPMNGSSRIEFYNEGDGQVNIEVFDITGKLVLQDNKMLSMGKHTFEVFGLNTGFYIVSISNLNKRISGNLISTGKNSGYRYISYQNNDMSTQSATTLKSAKTDVIQMQYNDGERLLFKGMGFYYTRVLTLVPITDRTINFEFIPCTDADNNHYAVVTIGTQTWMAENLKTTKYNDGTNIPLVTDDNAWNSLTTPAYCWNGNDQVTYGTVFGALYNWYVVSTSANGNKNVCPADWHVPSDAEWTKLKNYLIANGYNYDATYEENMIAKSLSSTTYWESSLIEGVVGNTDYAEIRNSFGFSALPAGRRTTWDSTLAIGIIGSWWSAPEKDFDQAFYQYMHYENTSFYGYYTGKGLGFSIRCLNNTYGEIDILPSLHLSRAFNITKTSFTAKAVIKDDYGLPVTARGFVWSTSDRPTVGDNMGNTIDGQGTGEFELNITGLTPGKTYYLRAYVTQNGSVKYSNQLRIITKTDEFYSVENAHKLEEGLYRIVGGGKLWDVSWGASIQNWTYGSVASDDAYKGSEFSDQTPINEIERWEVDPSNNYPGEKWKLNIEMGVKGANDLLNVLNLSDVIPSNLKSELKPEAHFLRAFFNFEAWLVFKNIPIFIETGDSVYVSYNNPDGAVLAHLINDLKYAWENLPHRQTQPGRPTKWSAKALAARAYLQELKYTEAKPLLQDIIDNGGFSLMPNFMDNYRIAHRNNIESIFEIQAIVNDGTCCSGRAEMGIGINFPHGSDIGMCCGFHQPSKNLVNAFRVNANGLPMFDTFNNTDLKNDQGVDSWTIFVPFTDVVDPRLDWTVSRRGIPYRDWGINRGRDWIRYQPFGGPYMPASKPFFNKSERYEYSDTTGWMRGVNANNFRYIRYAHIILWRAEVAAFQNDIEHARVLVNQIRARAANEVVMGKVNIYSLPPQVYPWGNEGDVDWTQPAANYNIGLYQGELTSAKHAMEAVQWELRLEFATEGMRFFDLRRWDNLPSYLKVANMADVLNNYAQSDLRIRNFMEGAFFTERDKYQPIPQYYIDMQPGFLIQNPGY